MKVGITGANGFIGNHLTRYVASLGHQVVAFLRTGTPEALIEKFTHQIFRGDITESSSLNPFLQCCDVVFHLAGFNRYWARDPNIFYQINYLGAKNLAASCQAHDIEKLVHVSSCITLGASEQPIARHEASAFNLQGVRFLYAETKKAGEDAVKHYAKHKGLVAVIVNPAAALGEMDYAPTPTNKPIVDICKGFWPVYVAGGACFIDVQDLVRGLWLALERGRCGEQYLLVGDNLSNQEFMTRVAAVAGRRQPTWKIPKPVLGVVAHCGEWLANRVTHKHPPLTVGMNALIGRYLYYDGAKARAELGFTPKPCHEAIERSVRWFKEHGYV